MRCSFVDVATTTLPPCSADQWQCASGQCIQGSERCNRRYDCADGTDEFDCQSGMYSICANIAHPFICLVVTHTCKEFVYVYYICVVLFLVDIDCVHAMCSDMCVIFILSYVQLTGVHTISSAAIMHSVLLWVSDVMDNMTALMEVMKITAVCVKPSL